MALPKVLYGKTKNKDIFYATKMDFPDPIFFIVVKSKNYIFLDQRDFGLFKEKNKDLKTKPVLLDSVLRAWPANKLAIYLFKKYRLIRRPVNVPADFPLALADFLRIRSVKLIPKIPFWPERERKTKEELKKIRESVKKTEKAFALVEKILQDSTIRGGKILHKNNILTSEFLKKEAEILLSGEGMVNEEGIIISSGEQTAVPHHPGSGPIKPHRPIICDIFPKDRATGYFGDITRAFIKGEPFRELQKMYEAVKKAQEEGIKIIKPGVKAKDVYGACASSLLKSGYDVGDKGFIHGAGHGIGLDVHEAPLLTEKSDAKLAPGNVITVEPGLYYPKIGGIRVEDVVYITKDGREVVSSHPKNWIIK